MVPQLIARVDGLPEVLLHREVVWPVPHDNRDETVGRCRRRRELGSTANRRGAYGGRVVGGTGRARGGDRNRLGVPGGRAGALGDPGAARPRGGAVMGVRTPGPVGWAAVALLAVAYAHVLLELAGAALAIAIAVRLLGRPARGAIGDRVRAGRLLDRPRCQAAAVDRSLDGAARRGRESAE